MPGTLRVFARALPALWLSACAAAPTASYWGADATATPGWSRLGDAALTAAADPMTWLPAAAAAGLQLGKADQEIADWANAETPVFGSRATAADASHWLRAGSYVLYGASGLLAPAPESRWLATKAKGFAVGGTALLATRGLTEAGKALGSRRRPLDRDADSLPSGHASMTAAAARLTHDALAYHDLRSGARLAGGVGLAGLALTTGWARVEAGEHYPVDVLAGLALGNFVAVFANEAFLAPASGDRLHLGLAAGRQGMLLQFSLGF